jgi:hypothetical protein
MKREKKTKNLNGYTILNIGAGGFELCPPGDISRKPSPFF